MNVLIACEETATIREEFTRLGHNAWSCDLLPSRILGNHYQCDVREVLTAQEWDVMIAHPPCTYLSYAGNRYWNVPGRDALRQEAMKFFMDMVNAPIPRICIENPVGYPNTVYRKPDQIIHPFYFGDRQLKRTCLWLKNLPPLWYWDHNNSLFQKTATQYPEPIYATLRANGTIKLRHYTEAMHGNKIRSVTFPGIARAMAEQWKGVSK